MTKKEYRDILIESEFNKISLYVDKFLKKGGYKYHYLREELESLGGELLVDCPNKYNPLLSSFSTFFENAFNNRMLDIVRKEKAYRKKVVNGLDSEFLYNMVVEEDQGVDKGELLSYLSNCLSEEEMKIVNQHFTGNLTNREMQNELGLSRTTYKRKKSQLKKKISELLIESELLQIKEGTICLK